MRRPGRIRSRTRPILSFTGLAFAGGGSMVRGSSCPALEHLFETCVLRRDLTKIFRSYRTERTFVRRTFVRFGVRVKFWRPMGAAKELRWSCKKGAAKELQVKFHRELQKLDKNFQVFTKNFRKFDKNCQISRSCARKFTALNLKFDTPLRSCNSNICSIPSRNWKLDKKSQILTRAHF